MGDQTPGNKVDSKFRFVLVAAQRAEQLMRGARPKVELGKVKSTRVAMAEVNGGMVDWNYGPAPEPEPQAAEAEAPEAVAEVH
jgi:DNA-directed RNA polymerase omega subunit